MTKALLLVLVLLTLGVANGHGADTDLTLDLPVEVPALLTSSTAGIYSISRSKPRPDPIQPPPADDEEDPRDEPPPVIFGEEIDSENNTIIYVLDTSGSMSVNNRIGHAKIELARSIEGLSPSFRFNLINYSCTLTRLFPALVPANDSNKAIALAYVAKLGDSGGTGTGPAVALGLSDKQVQSAVLLTDGGPNCGASGAEGHRKMIRNANTQAATINVFGIDASGELRAFCQNVAADSGGSYFDLAIR